MHTGELGCSPHLAALFKLGCWEMGRVPGSLRAGLPSTLASAAWQPRGGALVRPGSLTPPQGDQDPDPVGLTASRSLFPGSFHGMTVVCGPH